MRWGCLWSIALFAGTTALMGRQVQALGLPQPWVFAVVLALGVTLGVGSLQGVWLAWRQRGQPETAPAKLRDGALVRLSGVLRAEGHPVRAPISDREALFVRYAGTAAEADGDQVGTRRPHWRGQRSAPCRLQGGTLSLRLRGFPTLRHVAEQQFSGPQHHDAAARVLEASDWQLEPELPALDLHEAAQDLAAGAGALNVINRQALQRLGMTIGKTKQAELLQRLPDRPWVFRERVVPPGVPVTVVGTYRAAQGVLDVGYGPQSPGHEIFLGEAGALARRQFGVAAGFAAVLWAATLAGLYLVLADDGARVRAVLAALGVQP
jgi:hypothetical protein